MNSVRLTIGDITTARVDAIVNAANSALQRGGGVCGAIHAAAGPALQSACDRVDIVDGLRCPVGEARITEAGDLPARFVIHAVGPRYQIDEPSDQLLASAYRSRDYKQGDRLGRRLKELERQIEQLYDAL